MLLICMKGFWIKYWEKIVEYGLTQGREPVDVMLILRRLTKKVLKQSKKLFYGRSSTTEGDLECFKEKRLPRVPGSGYHVIII